MKYYIKKETLRVFHLEKRSLAAHVLRFHGHLERRSLAAHVLRIHGQNPGVILGHARRLAEQPKWLRLLEDSACELIMGPFQMDFYGVCYQWNITPKRESAIKRTQHADRDSAINKG